MPINGLQTMKTGVTPLGGNKLIVISIFHDSSILNRDDPIRAADR